MYVCACCACACVRACGSRGCQNKRQLFTYFCEVWADDLNIIYIIAGDKIEKNEMGWTCGAYG